MMLSLLLLLTAPQQGAPPPDRGWYCLAEDEQGSPRDPMLITRLGGKIEAYMPSTSDPGKIIRPNDKVSVVPSDAEIEFDVTTADGTRDRWRVTTVGATLRMTVVRHLPGVKKPLAPVTGECKRVV